MWSSANWASSLLAFLREMARDSKDILGDDVQHDDYGNV